ncbi:hypothetical protein [Spirosoma sp. KUDC1026]|uniref:hypothetical protein n=1 Tax=Spirosoma sp. KUDC1026 TaxID=2745947 RepID=UPI00159BCD0B|nr:hypothetical protein [Spirosoma sp. KUDC1026]QKZ14613.1 hypothetical protein HU175_19075 [Spirosoma sp. KUDC1026]
MKKYLIVYYNGVFPSFERVETVHDVHDHVLAIYRSHPAQAGSVLSVIDCTNDRTLYYGNVETLVKKWERASNPVFAAQMPWHFSLRPILHLFNLI